MDVVTPSVQPMIHGNDADFTPRNLLNIRFWYVLLCVRGHITNEKRPQECRFRSLW